MTIISDVRNKNLFTDITGVSETKMYEPNGFLLGEFIFLMNNTEQIFLNFVFEYWFDKKFIQNIVFY